MQLKNKQKHDPKTDPKKGLCPKDCPKNSAWKSLPNSNSIEKQSTGPNKH
jgi:hypothetical protein